MENLPQVDNPWFSGLNQLGMGLADSLTEGVNLWASNKIQKEVSRYTTTQTARDASANQEAQAAAAPTKGKDADGATIAETDAVTVAGLSVKRQTLKYAGISVGVLLLAGLGYKALK